MKRYIIAAAAAAAVMCAQAQQIDPITKAVLNGYDQILSENPRDYTTLYERAAQLYQLSQYDRALNDLTKAIDLTPAKDADMRMREFTLLADAAVEVKNYTLALQAINSALALEPDDYANLYRKGNICLQLEQPQEAYRTFASMQRLKSRSQEAYIGMARALIMQKDYLQAADLMKEAENADPTNYITYCRLGDLYRDMDQPENAATNYILGFTMAKDPARPLNALVELARQNYQAVAMALDFAIDKSNNKVGLLFLKGNIACQSGHFTQADDALTRLLEYPDARIAGVYATLAQAQAAENRLEDALASINRAVDLQPAVPYYVRKSQIQLANGDVRDALVSAQQAVLADSSDTSALMAKANAFVAAKDADAALALLNEVVMMQPDNINALLLRAYVNSELKNDGKAAVGDFNRIVLEEAETFPAVTVKALAQAKSGKKIDADATVAKALEGKNSADDYYWAGVYYAQAGNLEKAAEMVRLATDAGYDNRYELTRGATPWLNLAPVRHLMH